MNPKLLYTYFISFGVILSFSLSIQGQSPCTGGMAGSYPCNNVDLMAFLPLSSIGGGSLANDVWGWVDPTNGNEYAIIGKNTGTAFVDVSDPVNPIYLGSLPPHAGNSSWRDIKVYKDHAFIGSEASGSGIQIFDLNNLRNVISPPVAFSETAFKAIGGSNRSHNIVINENSGNLYSVGTSTVGNGGPVFFNALNPTSLIHQGSYSLDGYTHDAQAIIYLGPDSLHIGKEIIFASNEDTQTIIDVTDKSNPSEISRTSYSGSKYTHQGWVTQDHKYLIFNDELDEQRNSVLTTTYIFDIQDLDSPSLAGKFVNTTAAIDHNLYTRGNYVYQSNYRSGLRILEMTDLSNGTMTEVGFFDVYPADDNANFNGTWSNYPYFPSGNIIVSSMNEGMFIVKPKFLPHFEIIGPDAPIYIHQGSDAVFELKVDSLYGFSDGVVLSQTGSPVGTTVNLNTTSLTIGNTGSLPVGNYSILIQGIDSGMTGINHSISVGMIVTAPCAVNVTSYQSTGTNTLTEAISCANPNEIITLSSSLANTTIDLGTSSYSLDKNLIIEADLADNITLSSSGTAPTITIDTCSSVVLKGFNINNTSITEATVLNKGNLTIENMTIQNSMGNDQIINSTSSQLKVKGTTTFKK